MTVSQNTARVGSSTAISVGLLAFLTLVVFPAAALGQREVTVPSEPSCPDCRIELVSLATLGDSLPESPGVLAGFIRSVRSDANGRYFLTYADPGRLVVWFDQDGQFGGTIGREGAGPGEYRWPAFLEVSDRDSLYIYDHANTRVSVLDPSLQFARSYNLLPPNLRVPSEVLHLADGRLVVNAVSATRARVGFPLHFVGNEGEFLDPFGGGDEVYRLDQLVSTYRRLARGREETFWAGRATAYVVEEYDATGQLLTVIQRDAEWFQPWSRTQPPTPERPPQPQLAGVTVMDDGLLWVSVLVPDPRWHETLVESRTRRGDIYYNWEDWNRVYDTVIEVIDPTRGELVTSTSFSRNLQFMTREGLVGSFRDNEDGYRFVDIWQMRLIH